MIQWKKKTFMTFIIIMSVSTCRQSEESCSCLWAAHAVLRHALVHAIVLWADIEHAQHLCRHPMTGRWAQWLSVVEPNHSGCRFAPHLTAKAHSIPPRHVLLLQLHTHLRRLWNTIEEIRTNQHTHWCFKERHRRQKHSSCNPFWDCRKCFLKSQYSKYTF